MLERCLNSNGFSILPLNVPAVMTVNIPQAVFTYIVMYLILKYYNEVSPTLAGLACVCMLACSYLPYKVQNKNTIFKHVLLKQDVDSSGFSDYTTAHECKHLSMSESLLIVSDSILK